jgi:hypothetical protein
LKKLEDYVDVTILDYELGEKGCLITALYAELQTMLLTTPSSVCIKLVLVRSRWN